MSKKTVSKLIISISISAILVLISFFFWEKPKSNQDIFAVVVPHHDLVKQERSDLLKKIGEQTSPKTIVLVSPNHFDAGDYNVLTATKIWQIASGLVYPDTEKINKLLIGNSLHSDDLAFEREHGIFNLLGNIKENFPGANVIPIILKENTNDDELINLNESLLEVCRNECLMINSIDFSHYLPGALAEIHDDLSIRSLTNLDSSNLDNVEIDSVPALSLMIKYAKSNFAQEFVLDKHLNSGQIEYNPDAETTSYVLGYFQKGTPKLKESFSFMLGGDVMLGRLIDYTYKNNLEDVWSSMSDRFFNGVDLSLVNLEGPISSTPTNPDNNDQSLVFSFPPETVKFLKDIKINAVNLANNHVFNQGWSGFENTRDVLNKNNIATIGIQSGVEAQSSKRFQSGKQKVSVITVNLTQADADLTQKIKEEKTQNSKVIVYAHWGNEYEKTHSEAQSKYAYSWIDSGADLVVGTHPHVVQDAEIYKNRPIFYSLGNLIFDQQFSEEVKNGLVLAGIFEGNNLKIALIPIYNNNLKPEISTGSRKFNIIYKVKNRLNLYTNWSYGYDIINFELK